MRVRRRPASWMVAGLVVASLVLGACAPGARPAAPAGPAPAPPPAAAAAPTSSPPPPAATDPLAAARGMPLDELHQKALAEGGTLSLYSTLSQPNPIVPAF